MSTDRPPPVTSKPGSDPAAPRRQTGVVRDGTIVFALVLVGFVAYALGAPATYRSTAVVVVQPVSGSSAVGLPKPGEGAQLLRQAALDPQVMMTLVSEERRPPTDTVTQVRSRIADSLSVESSDGKTFTFAATASSAERSQRICNAFAQQAANRAAKVLDSTPDAAADPGEKAKAELLAFLAAHPGIASEPVPTAVKPGSDPLVLALRAERTRIEAKLAQQPPADPDAENPYEDQPQLQNPKSLKLRLKEIDKVLDARAMAAARATAAPAPSSSHTTPEVRAEWQRLLKAVSDSRSAEPAPPPGPRLKVTLARAALPRLPIKPDRARLVLVGVLTSIIAGVLAALLRGTLEARAFRAYGMKTGDHPVAPPQTTLRLKQNQLPKLIGPAPEPPPTPLPAAPVQAVQKEPIPLAPRVPTSIGHPALAPTAITPIPVVPMIPLTPVPPAPVALTPATPVPPKQVPDTPIPPAPAQASNGDGPTVTIERPPNTEPYGERPRSPSGERAARRVTQIYGTPPPPDLKEAAKGLLTTQTYGSPPVAIPPHRPSNRAAAPEADDETATRANRTSLKPSPMIPVARSSSSAPPPPNAPGNRSNAPLIETSYSYVSTPLPPPPSGSDGYPVAPTSTQPYGRRRATPAQPGVIVSPANEPAARTPTPLLPPPAAKPSDLVVTPHPVRVEWRPDASLAPLTHKRLYPEIVSLAVDACFVVAVSGATGNAAEQARIACEIALGLAELGTPRVLLVEGNFHFPHVHKLMNVSVPITAGFSQQLQSRIQDAAARHWHVTQCSPTLHVLAEGVMRSPGLLLSRQFEEALRALRGGYDILVISAPAALSEPEGRALSDVVDGVVIVEAKARLEAAPEVTRYFSRHRFVRVLGV